jgi:iron(III) transport system permease protein
MRYILLTIILVFFAIFFIYPLFYVAEQSVWINGHFDLTFFKLLLTHPIARLGISNSLQLALVVTLLTTLISFPLSLIFQRYPFPGKKIFSALLLLPLIIPPFVGAIGFKQLLARFGSVNLLMLKFGLINQPIDWLGAAGFWGVVILETLHLYPIMYLNLTASLANLDPALEEAASGLGAKPFHRWRTVTLPLLIPGYFAGAIIVFLWSFADLGTPLIFEYRQVVPVMIFEMVTDMAANPMGYALVDSILLLTIILFLVSKRIGGRKGYASLTRKTEIATAELKESNRVIRFFRSSGLLLLLIILIFISILPHIGVILTSLSEEWFMTILPTKWTLKYYHLVFAHPLAASSIRNSLILSASSTILDILLGISVAYLVARKKIRGAAFLDILTMLSLTIPGIILAFGYITCFSGTFLDPRVNPFPLLIIGYSIRRLPYMVRSAYAGFMQCSVTLEEASSSLGAKPTQTFFRVTFPLIFMHVLVGSILAFAFAMLEVSDSLILAMQEKYYPITKAIYALLGRVTDGPQIASAMGVLGMVILVISFLIASQLLGKRMGDLFKVS